MDSLSSFTVEAFQFFAIVLTLNVVAACSVYWLLNKSLASSWFKASGEIAASYLSISALLFGLFVTNLASDIWSRHNEANLVLVNETGAVRNLLAASKNLPPADGEKLTTVVNAYVKAVLEKEWPAMKNGDHKHREGALAEFDVLSQTTTQIAIQGNQPKVLETRLIQATDNIQTSRLLRLSLAHDEISFVKWRSVITFSLFLLLSVGLVHLRNPRAMKITFTVTVICILASEIILFNNKSPYQGRDPISPTMLSESLSLPSVWH